MAKVYFVREEISMEVPVGTSVLEAEIRAGLVPDAPCGGLGTCGKCLPGGNPWEEKKGEDFRRKFFQKGEFPAGAAGENGAAGEAGDWGKKVRVGAAGGGCL